MHLPQAALEDWMRDYYFDTELDIGGSGVEDFSFESLRRLLKIDIADLDRIVFHDSKTLGGDGVRSAIADRFLDGDPERVLVTHGSTEANFLIMNSLLDTGDEVVVLDPCYQQLFGVAKALGCSLSHVPLRFERSFRLDLDELAAAITPRTRMVVVNFPHNPTGASITQAEQERLLEIVAAADAYLVWDGAFTELSYDQPPLPEPSLTYEKALSMGTFSKAYGLPGLRVGWCLGSPEVLRRTITTRDYITLHLSPLVEMLAQRAIENADEIVRIRMIQARRNRQVVDEWVRSHKEHVEWVLPMGGVCGLVRLRGFDDTEEFCRRLAKQHGVMLVPGTCFNRPGFARLGFGGPTPILEKALGLITTMLKSLDSLMKLESSKHKRGSRSALASA